MTFVVGQRWISETEAELGLGIVREVSGRHVAVAFPAASEERRYVAAAAPLKRVRFRAGDAIETDAGRMTLDGVEERGGLLVYRTGDTEIPEAQLADSLSFSRPDDRLRIGQVDRLAAYVLRQDALRARHESRRSPTRGMAGGRIDLIPHQLFIAHEVASRHAPRVLLADEVGLGKTIEAGMILHRLLATGRAGRVLIIVPDALIHQWLVEMLRRFNLWFRIFDEERCASMEAGDPECNPFSDEQLVLVPLGFLAGAPRRVRQAIAAGWDVLVVDEAHRLEWRAEGASAEYALVERLAAVAASVLLLTATPEQLGPEAHFARLRLLDPARYTTYAAFRAEIAGYAEVAARVDELLTEGPPSPERQAAIADLVDRHGTGRVMFRNTRRAIPEFPSRVAHLAPLRAPETPCADLSTDPRIPWLRDLLRAHADDKILLICRTRALVEAIDTALARLVRVRTAQFHEDISIVERDRHAAYFAEPDGARMLLCSEIGSEGRNFQFAHHLVLFDLPDDPELLEQRIGRLDRIGQTETIEVHVPYLIGTAHEVLARWHHEGLCSFEQCVRGGDALHRRLGPRVESVCERFEAGDRDEGALSALIDASRRACQEIAAELERGRDRLLERSSYDVDRARALGAAIREHDRDPARPELILRLLDHYGVRAEEITPTVLRLSTEHMYVDALPGLPHDGLTVTFDRSTAVVREDVSFLTWDHPLVAAVLDLLIGSADGNASFGLWEDAAGRVLLLEATFVLECVAPAALHVDRFLAPTPIRRVVDQTATDRTDAVPEQVANDKVRPAAIGPFIQQAEITTNLLPAMLERAQAGAESMAVRARADAIRAMRTTLDGEIERLRFLRARNDNVRPDEIRRAEDEAMALEAALEGARLRLDSVRLIWRGPALGG